MRDFCKISPLFWCGKTGKSIRGDKDAQIVALYLMTSPHSNMIGIYTLPMMYLAHETGLSIEGASKALTRLYEAGFCTFEADTELVWVHEMAKYQIGSDLEVKDKRCKGVQNELAKVSSSLIRQGFTAKYASDFHLEIEGKKRKPLRSPFNDPSKQREREREREGEGEGEHMSERFEKFWASYPRKVGKDAAVKAFAKREPDDSMLAEMLGAIATQAKAWAKEEPRFTPHPATWLNEGRWKDEQPAKAAAVWAQAAGFANHWEANNAGCYEHNAAEFEGGKRKVAA